MWVGKRRRKDYFLHALFFCFQITVNVLAQRHTSGWKKSHEEFPPGSRIYKPIIAYMYTYTTLFSSYICIFFILFYIHILVYIHICVCIFHSYFFIFIADVYPVRFTPGNGIRLAINRACCALFEGYQLLYNIYTSIYHIYTYKYIHIHRYKYIKTFIT